MRSLRLRARSSPLARCAVCHDALDDDTAVCPDCRTASHEDCRTALARCPSLGCPGEDPHAWIARLRVARSDPPRSRQVLAILAGVFAAFVVALAIAIPSGSFSRKGANEAHAVHNLRHILAAEIRYRAVHHGFARRLWKLRDEGLVDIELGAGTKRGYAFAIDLDEEAGETILIGARPVDPGETGDAYFCIDESGTVHRDRQRASAASPFLGK